MSVSLSPFNLWAAMGAINEWIDRETRPITWHKLQLILHKISLDLQRSAGGEVGVVDYAGSAGVLHASDPAVMRVDAGGLAVDLLADGSIEVAMVKWSSLLINEGGETITFKDSTGATTVGTVAAGESKFVHWDGSAWDISAAL